MIRQLHIHPKVEKTLQKSARTSALGIAAHRAARIIESLKNGTRLAQAGPLSQTKEARVRQLFKYDLGKGYRLITVKKHADLYILFIGDHDRCDRWLDTYSKKKPGNTEVELRSYPVRPPSLNAVQPDLNPDADEPGDEPLMLTQQQLRRVFCGLVQQAGT